MTTEQKIQEKIKINNTIAICKYETQPKLPSQTWTTVKWTPIFYIYKHDPTITATHMTDNLKQYSVKQ